MRALLVENVMEKLIASGCADEKLIRSVDILARDTLHDVHRAWMKWGFFVIKTLRGTSLYDDESREWYRRWAEDNCDIDITRL